MLRKLYSVIGVAIMVVGLNTAATAEVSDLKKTFKTFEILNVAAILTEAGVPFQISQLESGMLLFMVRIGPDQNIILSPTRCRSGPASECYSLLYMTVGNAKQLPYSGLGENLVVANYLGAMLDLSEVHINPISDNPVVVSVLNSDHGFAKGNLLATLGIHIQSTNYAFGELANLKAAGNLLSSHDSTGNNITGKPLGDQQHLRMAVRSPSDSTFLQSKASGLPLELQSMVKGNSPKSVLDDPAFQALMGTDDFHMDFGFQIIE